MIAVRPAERGDRAKVAAVLAGSYPVLMAPAYDARLLARVLPMITRPNPRLIASGTYYLAEVDGQAVGCGGWSRERPGSRATEPGIGHLRHFAVHAGWSGCGVGRTLYARCEREARAAGLALLECYASINAEPFYQAMGFDTLEPIAVPMANGLMFPSLRMRRPI